MKEVTVNFICDLCRKKEADRCFKIKEPVYNKNKPGLFVKRWKRMDICSNCWFSFLKLRDQASNNQNLHNV